jgi:hypothetical protein
MAVTLQGMKSSQATEACIVSGKEQNHLDAAAIAQMANGMDKKVATKNLHKRQKGLAKRCADPILRNDMGA